MPRRWVRQLSLLAAWLIGALLLGFWFDAPAWWVAAALGLYLANMLRELYQLDSVISGRNRPRMFDTHGFWAQLIANVDQLRAKARTRKRRYHRLVREVRESTAALSDAGVVLNADGEIVWFNATATAMLGFDPARDLGQRIDNLLRYPAFVDYLASPREGPISIPSPQDDSRTLSAQCIPYGRDQRLAIFRDITHETHLERTRRDFVANASHELRSPLTVIAGYLDALADDPEMPKTWRAPVDEMLRQCDRMTRILRDLIELTRLDTVDSAAAREFVDVEQMLRGIVGEFASRSAHAGLTLDIQTDAALLGSEADLHSIFFNLISNAIRFTPADGSIRVVWRTDGDGAAFEVIDTGIGISEDLIPRLTERFYRVDKSRSRATGGTGLGLAIVKHAVQRHGGELRIASREGEGSTFSCHFGAQRLAFRGGHGDAAV